MWRDHTQGYGRVSRGLHWGMAALLGLMFIGSWWMGDVQKPLKFLVYNLHKLMGLTLLFLFVMRVIWRSVEGQHGDASAPMWQQRLAAGVHGALYAVMGLMPLSGWWMATASGHLPHLGGVDFAMPWVQASKANAAIAATIHTGVAWAALALLTLHISAALHHKWYGNDKRWAGMWRGQDD